MTTDHMTVVQHGFRVADKRLVSRVTTDHVTMWFSTVLSRDKRLPAFVVLVTIVTCPYDEGGSPLT